MKKTLMVLSAMIVLSLVLTNIVFAQGSISMTISCTIPAIPGLNAPIIEEEALETKADAPEVLEANYQEATLPEAPSIIPQDSQEERVITEVQQESLVIVKTIYDR